LKSQQGITTGWFFIIQVRLRKQYAPFLSL